MLNAIFGGAVLYQSLALIRFRPLWGLWIAFALVIMVFTLSHDRYFVQILPLGRYLRLVYARSGPPSTSRLRKLGNCLFALFFFCPGIGFNNGRIWQTIYVQHRTPFLAHYKEGHFPAYLEMARHLTELTTPRDTIIAHARFARMLSYFSQRRVVELRRSLQTCLRRPTLDHPRPSR